MLLDENELFIFDWDGTLATSGALIRVSKMLKARYKLGYILKHKERYRVRSVNDLVIKEEKGKLVSTYLTMLVLLTSAISRVVLESLNMQTFFLFSFNSLRISSEPGFSLTIDNLKYSLPH